MNWENSAFECLRGQVVQEVGIADHCIQITTDKPIYFGLEADCCSETWLYRVRGVKNLIGHKVQEIVEIDTSDIDYEKDGLGRQDYDEVYGIGLKTEQGICEFVYRNSSNGYYGGWIQQCYNKPKEQITLISEDFEFKLDSAQKHATMPV